LKLFRCKSFKPDYLLIQAKTCREIPVVVRRIILHEKLDLQAVHHFEGRRTFDVVLLTADRLVIVRHFHGTKQAHFQEFQRDRWEAYTDPEYPDLMRFLSRYHAEVQPLADHWIYIREVEEGK